MMGHQQRVQKKLFYTKLDLDQRIRKDHILRKVKKTGIWIKVTKFGKHAWKKNKDLPIAVTNPNPDIRELI
jgi:hypothetical protein